MLDINFIRENPDAVRENIKRKFRQDKLPLVDEVIELDKKRRELQKEGDSRRADRNRLAKLIGTLMREGKKDEAEEAKAQSKANNDRVAEIERECAEVEISLKKAMTAIPNMIAPDVPDGRDDSQNVQGEVFLEAKAKPF